MASYHVQVRTADEPDFYGGGFNCETVEEILKLQNQLPAPKYELRIQTYGWDIETIYLPYKGLLIQKILENVNSIPLADGTFSFRYKVPRLIASTELHTEGAEAVTRWVFRHLGCGWEVDRIELPPEGKQWMTVHAKARERR